METTIKTKYSIGDTIRLYDGIRTFTVKCISVYISADGVDEIGYWGAKGGFYNEETLMADEYKEKEL